MFDEATASTCYQLVPQDIANVPKDWDSLHCLLEKNCQRIYHNQNTDMSFPILQQCLQNISSVHVYDELIPFLWESAFRPLPISTILSPSNPVITLTKTQCLSILAKAFFCMFHRDSHYWDVFPSINFDRLYWRTRGFDGKEKTKLQMILDYFCIMYQRSKKHPEFFVDEEIQFVFSEAEFTWKDWSQDQSVLSPLTMKELRLSLDDAKDCYRMDFANAYLGGASLSYGSVQEEIMFSICPEMNVGRLFCPRMKEHQAIGIFGTEQFTHPQGYGSSLQYGERYTDTTVVLGNKRQSFVCAIDALDFRRGGLGFQYTSKGILRELNKCYAAMSVSNTPSSVATGNWGCGVFGGDVALKILIQWMAASRAGKSVVYYPFDDQHLYDQWKEVQQRMQGKEIRVSDLILFFEAMEPRHILKQFLAFFL